MATKTSTQNLSNLVINRVVSEAAYQDMVTHGQVNENELYFVEGDTVVVYNISKNNGTITLTGSDSSTSSVTLTATDVGALPSNTPIPDSTSDLTNDSNFISDASYVHTDNNFTTTLKGKLEGIEAGATVDDHKWNDVTLNKSAASSNNNYYVAAITSGSTSDTEARLVQATTTPTGNAIPKYNVNKYLISTTPDSTDNTTKVATTAFVKGAIDASIPAASTTAPSMDGTASYGSGTTWARADHVHPTDTSRAPTNHATSATTYGTGTSSNYGHLKLSDSTSSTSSTSGGIAATPSAVKAAYDLANGKQNAITVVYGTLAAASWNNGSQAVSFTGLAANQNAVIGLAQTSTVEQDTAAAKAKLKVTAQAAGSVTIIANGTVPTVDIPLALILY